MIGLGAETRVWLASGATDMRRGFDGLALLGQETLKAGRCPGASAGLSEHAAARAAQRTHRKVGKALWPAFVLRLVGIAFQTTTRLKRSSGGSCRARERLFLLGPLHWLRLSTTDRAQTSG